MMKKALCLLLGVCLAFLLCTCAPTSGTQTGGDPGLSTAQKIQTDPAPIETAMPDDTTVLPDETTPREPEPVREKEAQTITLTFLGDLNLSSEYYNTARSSFNRFAQGQNPAYFLEALYPILSQDDMTFGNLENVLTDADIAPAEKDHSPAFWYRAPTSFAQFLRAGSVEVASVANNHTLDFGYAGLADTKAALERADVIWGDSAHTVEFEKNGIRISVLCTTISSGGYCAGGDAWLERALTESDYQILYFHGGVNFGRVPDETVMQTCRAYADRGVDLIVGHHPHILQRVEQYGDVLIAPSLGSCVFGHGGVENAGAILQLTLSCEGGRITQQKTQFIPIYVAGNPFQPEPMYEDDAARVLDFLSGDREQPK